MSIVGDVTLGIAPLEQGSSVGAKWGGETTRLRTCCGVFFSWFRHEGLGGGAGLDKSPGFLGGTAGLGFFFSGGRGPGRPGATHSELDRGLVVPLGMGLSSSRRFSVLRDNFAG